MRNLIVQQFVTVNNIAAEKDGGLSFVTGQAYSKSADENFKTEAMKFLGSIDTMILGSNTYKMFSEYWPNAVDEGEFGEKLNRLNKYVASTKLNDAPWGDFPAATVTSDPVKTLQELKAQDGKDIVLWGSLTLMSDCFKAGLVDEVQLRICPTTRGEGTQMFDGQYNFELIDITPYERGVVVAKYKIIQ